MLQAINRLREPSTWAGVSALGMLFGVNTEGMAEAGAMATAGLAGLFSIFMREKASFE